MMKKRLSKTLWYGSDIDKEGKPVLPPLAEDANDLEGIHEGELYLHLGDGSALLFTRSADGQVVQLGSNADELANYLLKSVWDKAFEIRTTENGEEYLFTKLNLATQYGITMYANGGLLDLPSIFDGLPIDNDTIYWDGEVLKSRGVGEGGVTPTLLGDLTNVGAWANAIATEDRIMVQKKDSSSWEALELSKIGGSVSFENVKESGEGNAFTSFVLSDDKKTLTFVKDKTFAEKSNTLSGYGITDAYTKTEADNLLAKKWTQDDNKITNWDAAFGWGDHSKANYATKSSTLSGYGITNAYTKTDVDNLLNGYLPLTGGTITGDIRLRRRSEYISPYLYFGDVSEVWLKEESDTYLTIHADGGVNIDSPATFIDGIKIEKSADGVLYIDADLVLKGGVTMFANEGSYTPSTIMDAVSVDNQTIIKLDGKLMVNPELVFGGGGGGEVSSVAWGNIIGTPTWITDTKPVYRYTEISGTPDLSVYATKGASLSHYGITDAYTKTSIDSLLSAKWTKDDAKITNWDAAYSWGNHAQAGYFKSVDFTKNKIKTTLGVSDWALASTKPSYTTKEVAEDTNLYFTNARAVSALADTLKGYVTLSGAQTISGEKNFTGGLKVNGSPIVYNATGKYWKLEGDLLVTGGITMFGSDSSFIPSTITQAVNIDGSTLVRKDGVIMLNPDIEFGGGVVDSVAWDNIDGKPSWITKSKPEYKYSEIKETPDLSGYAKKATTLSGYGITDATMKTSYDFRNGNLVRLDVGASVNAMITVIIRGNSYTHSSLGGKCINTCVEFYNYNTDNLIYNANATHFGLDFGDISIFNYDGYICLWFAGSDTYRTYSVEAFYTNSGGIQSNKVKSITDSAMPTSGVTRLVTITPIKGVDTRMYTASDVLAKMLTKDGAGSGLDADKLDGQEGSYYASAASLANYLPLSGGVLTGALTTQSVSPSSSNSYDLGSSTLLWRNIYTKKATIDGIEIKKSASGVLFIDANLVVSGGITMYGTDGTTANTIWDDAPIASTSVKGIASFDSNFFAVNNGKVTFVGQTGGGVADSVAWGNVTGKPTWIGSNKPSYTTSEVTEGTNLYFTNARAVSALSSTLSNYLTLSGGTINGMVAIKPTNIAGVQDGIVLHDGGYGSGESLKIKWTSESYKTGLSLCVQQNNGSLLFENSDGFNTVWHSGNVGSGSGLDADKLDGQEGSYYAPTSSLANYLPLSGGTLTDKLTGTTIVANDLYWREYKNKTLSSGGWYRFATSTRPDSYGNTYILSICRVYNSTSNESYLIAVTLDYSGCSFTQLVGHRYSAAVQLVTKIRCTRTHSGDVYFDFYYTGSSQNTVYVNAIGHCKVQTPEATSSTLTYTDEFSLEEGVKSSLGFIGDLKGNADTATSATTATSASKLSTVSKTAWGQTYWTSDGIPANISGDMSSVGSITPSTHNTYSIGYYGNGFAWSNFNCISSGAVSNNLWLCGGTNSGTGVVIARSGSNTATGELCRFTDKGMVWASGVIPAIVSTAQEIHLKYNNADATSIVFNGASFKPFISASDNIMLGRYDSLWRGLFLSTDASVPRTEKGVTFCSSNGYAEGKIGANSRGIGIYTVGGLYLRGGCIKGANGTMTESSTGAVIDASGNMLVTGGVTMYSDLRKKTILNHVELSLKEVADAPLIEHYYNSDESKRTHVGSVAQYWAGLNDWFCKEDEEGYLTMEIQNAALASAISVARELTRYESKTDKQIKKLKKRIGELEEEIENLKNK